ncbi:MarR family winged helix-turn-helix transcriptional regulator [Shimia sp.]|uniref:MarR family winged helix-turn-helix transcriptional regulator n=1 Tax=Shimia sp. TaxID=1954381 RepID=UPI0035691B59
MPQPPQDRRREAAEADRSSHLDEMLCFEVYSAEHAFGRLYKSLLQPLGLTYPQFLVMVLLWERDGRSIGGLGRVLGLESNTLTPLVKRLEAAGLVSRQRDRQDERRVRVALTEAGRAMRASVGHVRQAVIAATGMSEVELAALFGALRKLRAGLSDT